jgi:hypothetical protein
MSSLKGSKEIHESQSPWPGWLRLGSHGLPFLLQKSKETREFLMSLPWVTLDRLITHHDLHVSPKRSQGIY